MFREVVGSKERPEQAELVMLVDYDNLGDLEKRLGVSGLARKLAGRVLTACQFEVVRMRIRFYGGWYSSEGPTRLAQKLAAEIEADFPQLIRKRSANHSSGNPFDLVVSAELAYSLLSSPACHLLATYRTRPFSSRVSCASLQDAGCLQSPCALEALPEFFQKQRCPVSGCSVKMRRIMTVAQQKLVDVMLATDMIFFASDDSMTCLAVVCGDDDLWPAIQHASEQVNLLLHLFPRFDRATPAYYTNFAGSSYFAMSIRDAQ